MHLVQRSGQVLLRRHLVWYVVFPMLFYAFGASVEIGAAGAARELRLKLRRFCSTNHRGMTWTFQTPPRYKRKCRLKEPAFALPKAA